MLDAMEAPFDAPNLDKMNLPTPSTGPSMSPNTLPSDEFDSSLNSSIHLDDKECPPESPEHRGPDLSSSRERPEGDAPALPSPVHGTVEAPKAPIFSDEVARTLVAIQDDSAPRVVLQSTVGWTSELCHGTVFPLLCHTRNTAELVIVDMLTDEIVLDVCAVLSCNPSIVSLVLLGPSVSMPAVTSLASLIVSSVSLRALSLMHCLRPIAPQAMQVLGEAVLYSRSLISLNLEGNGIQDADLLPLAQALAAQRTLVDVNLDGNHLGYRGLDMLCEVMGYNERIQALTVTRNLVRCPTDVYEGFFIHEQCQVNREVARLGSYTAESHCEWPSLWRRKMRRLWYVWSKHNKTSQGDWEQVLQWLDSRGYIEQKVKQWMRLESAPQQQPVNIWRHT